MSRVIRMQSSSGQGITQSPACTSSIDRRIRLDEDTSEIKSIVDKYAKLSSILKIRDAAHKQQTESMRLEIADLKDKLVEYATEKQKSKIIGTAVTATFSPSVRKQINPKKFLNFLKSLSKTNEFWEYASVPVGETVKNYGEAVLSSADVLTYTADKYGNLKIVEHST